MHCDLVTIDASKPKKAVKRQLIRELNGEFQCPGCPPAPQCSQKADCPICKPCKECPVSCSETIALSPAELAAKYLVTDFEPVETPPLKKVDFEEPTKPNPKCASNPELNQYINKPKFSRDNLDYDTTRKGYEPKKLVCDEAASHAAKVQSQHWLEECNDVQPLSKVVSIVGANLTSLARENLNDFDIVTPEDKISTPYALVLSGTFDFDQDDANIWRMVREAEAQNADLVTGAWRDELGHWSSSCLHYSLKNYTLHIWDGYYKSISSMKYCDMSLGPVLVRAESYEQQLASQNPFDRFDYHLRRPELRVITCQDCMFYQGNPLDVSRDMLMPLAYVYSLNTINYLGKNYEFTCPEAGIKCDVNYYNNNGLAQPPCCLRVLTGITLALREIYKDQQNSLCIYCGQVLAALKMPGGQLPWDTDVDMPMMAINFMENVDNLCTEAVSITFTA